MPRISGAAFAADRRQAVNTWNGMRDFTKAPVMSVSLGLAKNGPHPLSEDT